MKNNSVIDDLRELKVEIKEEEVIESNCSENSLCESKIHIKEEDMVL